MLFDQWNLCYCKLGGQSRN